MDRILKEESQMRFVVRYPVRENHPNQRTILFSP
jgi:hypothetical protein